MAHRLVQCTSSVDTPVAPDIGTWTNPANVRDGGDPPPVDGTNANFATITCLSTGPVSAALRIHSPTTLSPQALIIGVEVDWEVTSVVGGSATFTIQATGEAFPTTIFFGSSPAARQRFRYMFTNAGRQPGSIDAAVKLVASIGTSSSMTARIYEVGYWIIERVRPVRMEG